VLVIAPVLVANLAGRGWSPGRVSLAQKHAFRGYNAR
jgi:hypothetical protein